MAARAGQVVVLASRTPALALPAHCRAKAAWDRPWAHRRRATVHETLQVESLGGNEVTPGQHRATGERLDFVLCMPPCRLHSVVP
jgi:hypothetical protein